MSFEQSIGQIESHEFAAQLNIASDFRTFLRGLLNQQSVRNLSRELDSREGRQKLFLRAIQLARQLVDHRYENQWDTALSVYLWLINNKDSDLAALLASTVAQTPQCWWAKKISHYILLGEQAYVETGSISYDIAPVYTTGQSLEAGEKILTAGFLGDINLMETGRVYIAASTTQSDELSTEDEWLFGAVGFQTSAQNTNSDVLILEE